MKKFSFGVTSILSRLSLDGTLIYGGIRIGWNVISALLTILLVAQYLTPDAQGYFYTFYTFFQVPALALAGFYVALLAGLSHAWARVRVTADGKVEGDAKDIRHLGGLLRLSWRWHLGCTVVFACVLGPVGHVFFAVANRPGPDWQLPWWCLSLTIAVSFLNLPDSLTLESSGKTSLQQKILLAATILSTFIGFAALPLGAGLYAPAIITAARTTILWLLLRRNTRSFRRLPFERIDWRRDVLPLQFRVTVSWLFGFIIFQAFVPTAFMLSGPIVAGHLGVVLQIYMAVTGTAAFWFTRTQPQMGAFASLGRWKDLDRLTKSTGVRATATAAGLSIAALLLVQAIWYFAPAIGAKFGDTTNLCIFLAVAVALQYSSAMVAAVRLAKVELFYVQMGVSAAVVLLTEFVLGRHLGELGYGLAFTIGLCLVAVPWDIYLYHRFISGKIARSKQAPSSAVNESRDSI